MFSEDLRDSTGMVPGINESEHELGDFVQHEEFCTLCGMPFWAYMELGSHDFEGDISWLGYFLVRK